MTNTALPDGTIKVFKEHCDSAVIAAGGRTKVAQLLDCDESFLSKACRENYREMLSRDHLLLLGVSGGGAALARFFASFSHAHVVPFDDGPEEGADDLISDIGRIAKEHSEAIASLVKAAQRGTPALALDAMKEISDVGRALDQAMWKLAVVAAKGSGDVRR